MFACPVFKAEEHGKAFPQMQLQGILSFFRDEYGAAEASEAASLRRAHSAEFPLPPLPEDSSSGSDDDDGDTASFLSDQPKTSYRGAGAEKLGPRPSHIEGTPETSPTEAREEEEEGGGGEPASFLAAPYVRPLAGPSAASLTHDSLQICTENLGSETGSEGFSSYPQYDASHTQDHPQPLRRRRFESPERKSPARTFPPPLPSLSHQLRSRRENGRLVLEAVSHPPPAYFRAQRLGGRLLLSLVGEGNENGTEGGLQSHRDETPPEPSPAGSTEPHRLAIVAPPNTKNTVGREAKAHYHFPSLPRIAYSKAELIMGLAYFQAAEGELLGLLHFENGDSPKSHRPQRVVARFNALDGPSWKSKNAPSPPLHSLAHPHNNHRPMVDVGNTQLPPLLLLRSNATDCLSPLFRGCKQPTKTSIVIWEPYRIAASS